MTTSPAAELPLATHSHAGERHAACHFQPIIDDLRAALNAVLRGKQNVVELVLACLLARGHLLIEDLPGLGKTTLAKALAHAVGGSFARVQCTPDLLPSDITGFNILNQKTREFEFTEGPVFSDVLLADEINRATPRTQSALFEAMAERQVSIDKACHRLSETFFVVATQNPVDSHGVYPLPEAQLDRFAMKLKIGYPSAASELEMLAADVGAAALAAPPARAVITPRELRALQAHVAGVHVGAKVQRYLVDLGAATRSRQEIALGLSPRGLLVWQRLAQAIAHLKGRDFVTPSDVYELAMPVLSLRLAGDFQSPQTVVEQVLASVEVPTLGAVESREARP